MNNQKKELNCESLKKFRYWSLSYDKNHLNINLSFGNNSDDNGTISDYDNLNQETNWIFDGSKLNYYSGNKPIGPVIFSINVSAILASNSLPSNYLGGPSGMGGSLTVVSDTSSCENAPNLIENSMNNQKEELKPCLIYRSLTTGQPDNCNPADSSVEGLGEFHVMPNGSEFYMLVWTGKWATYSNFMYSTNPEAEINECNGEKLTYMKVKVYCCDSVIKTEPC